MLHIADFLSQAASRTVLVVGDLMLDRYLFGEVTRISPEAPVPVVEVLREEARFGGAANVVLNLHSMGARPLMCGLIGHDAAGEQFRQLARDLGLDENGLMASDHRRTTVKTRVMGNHQHILRIDREDRYAMHPDERQQLLATVQRLLPQADALIFEDYDKGLLDAELIQTITGWCQAQGVPVVVDPKFRNFTAYTGCALFKPNLKELNEALDLRLKRHELPALADAALLLREKMPHANTLITLSENGMLLVDQNGNYHHLPAHPRSIADVSGAGDTVVAVMALGIACGLPYPRAAFYANLAGGLVCEHVGVVPIAPAWLREAGK
jgi:rfaE bifunctional protein kinase chain/domain